MAKDKDNDNEEIEEQEEGKAKSGSNLKIIIIAVVAAVLLSGGLVGGTVYFLSGDDAEKSTTADSDEEADEEEEVAEEDAEPQGPPMYHSLDPKFVVSFQDQRSARFMQFEIDIMTRSESTKMKIDDHMSAIRSSLLMLFDGQNFKSMSTREGKKQLLADITNDVNETIDVMAGDSEESASVESAYFTSFVIQ